MLRRPPVRPTAHMLIVLVAGAIRRSGGALCGARQCPSSAGRGGQQCPPSDLVRIPRPLALARTRRQLVDLNQELAVAEAAGALC